MKTSLYLAFAVFFVCAMHTCTNAQEDRPSGLKEDCLDGNGNAKKDGPPKKTQDERVNYLEKCADDRHKECLIMQSGYMNRPRTEVQNTCGVTLPRNYLQ